MDRTEIDSDIKIIESTPVPSRKQLRTCVLNPSVPIFEQPWCHLGSIPLYYTNPFKQPEITNNSCQKVLSAELAKTQYENVQLANREILQYQERILRCVPMRKAKKLTKREIRRNLSGTDLEGYQNITERTIQRMPYEECEAKMLDVITHVLKDLDPIEIFLEDTQIAIRSGGATSLA